MPTRPLPTCIIDLILKNTEPASLLACSLVCASWVYPARSRLFNGVTIQADHPTKNLQAFIAALETSSLGIFIRKLVLHANYQATINTHSLCSILSRTKYLRALHLSRLQCNDLDLNLFPLRADFQLQTLEIHHPGTVTDTCQNVLHILGLFASVDELVLTYVERGPSTLRVSIPVESLFVMPIPSRLSVGALRLGHFAHSDFYAEIFRRTRTREALKALSVQCSDLGPSYLQSLALLLFDTRPTLQQLSLQFTECLAACNAEDKVPAMFCTAREQISDKLRPALSALTGLHTFALQVRLPPQLADTTQAWSLMVCLLSALPTQSIRHITLTLEDDLQKTQSFGDPWCKLRVNWETARTVLETFPALETVTFATSTAKAEPPVFSLDPLEEQHIQNHLPGLVKRNLIRFPSSRPRKSHLDV
ncbi:hypothetical protein EIP86_007833 [Pleurotus ostreatoroseus]|nr:hypothetical protein EIP86_007833 [Pleurotus ostreatoroseus]